MPLTDEQQRILHRTASWCSTCERCSFDVEARLRKAEVDEEAIALMMQRLIDEGFINDERYARAFVRDKTSLQGWGPVKIRQQLSMKHIPTAAINAAMDELPDDTFVSELERFLLRRDASLHDDDPNKRAQKLIRAALSRGYSYDDIRQVLRRLGAADD